MKTFDIPPILEPIVHTIDMYQAIALGVGFIIWIVLLVVTIFLRKIPILNIFLTLTTSLLFFTGPIIVYLGMEIFIKKSEISDINIRQLIYSKKMSIQAKFTNHSIKPLKECRVRFYLLPKESDIIKKIKSFKQHIKPKKKVVVELKKIIKPNKSINIITTIPDVEDINKYKLYHWTQCRFK